MPERREKHLHLPDFESSTRNGLVYMRLQSSSSFSLCCSDATSASAVIRTSFSEPIEFSSKLQYSEMQRAAAGSEHNQFGVDIGTPDKTASPMMEPSDNARFLSADARDGTGPIYHRRCS